ncbi:MAG: sigma-54 dependent transcriptional regulator [Candidatus Azobacteroides sp.]|nr:sigma-54 dependent transcriptional regulator [Candidatus Azobacteroides sp.]
MKNILIVEDDLTLSLMLKTWLSKKGFDVRTVLNIADAKKETSISMPDLVLSDLRLPDDSGIAFLKWVKEINENVVFIMMTGYAEIQTAVESIKLGAFDYIAKPLNPEELLKKIEQASDKTSIKQKIKAKETKDKTSSEFIRGKSPEYKRLYEYVDLVAPTRLIVLIRGESGVGKEHIAKLIHEKSDRAKGPFIPVDCGVLSKELAASEFFGHIKGSFTGAINNKTGHFLEADGGTLFLDEIGNLPTNIQMQLLRVLQEKKIKPVGSNNEIPVDVRIVSATNENLDKALAEGTFRLDLYHRIDEFTIQIPSLQECKSDIELFAHHFLNISNNDLNKNVIGFTPETINIMKDYSWPGNLRELKNVVNRMVLIAPDNHLTVDLLPPNIVHTSKQVVVFADKNSLSLKNNHEKERIEEALRQVKNNKSKAAELLDIDRKTLYMKMKQYGIEY